MLPKNNACIIMRQRIFNINLVRFLVDLTNNASSAILQVYAEMLASGTSNEAAGATRKDDGSPVTRADLLAHECIARGLAGLDLKLPVVSEEDPESLIHRLPQGRYWLVDPLDGTKEFLARNGEFTVNIALIEDGLPVLGVVAAPVLGLTYWGGRELGAVREHAGQSTAIAVTPPRSRQGQPLRVLASKSHLNAATSDFLARLGPHELMRAGSSLKFCRIAEGAADLYPRMGPTCEWDTAAGHAVLAAAGGCVSALDGTELRYGKPDVLNPHFIASASPHLDQLAAY